MPANMLFYGAFVLWRGVGEKYQKTSRARFQNYRPLIMLAAPFSAQLRSPVKPLAG